MRKIKQAVRSYLEKKKAKEYEKSVNLCTVSYDQWIREREKEQFDLPPNIPEQKFLLLAEKKEGLKEGIREHLSALFYEHDKVSVIYGDEDEYGENQGERKNPWLKPDYSPDTLFSYFYFGGFTAIKKEVLLRLGYEKLAEYDLLLIEEAGREEVYELVLTVCLSLKREEIFHTEKILYTSPKAYRWGEEKRYLDLKERAEHYRKKGRAEGVSVIIPSKDNCEVLFRCIDSVIRYTKDVVYEIILVDNGSREENKRKIEQKRDETGFTYFYEPMEFNFSAMCNKGAKAAKYDLLLFLNDDCEVLEEHWLSRMAGLAVHQDTGAVGAKLYYPNSKRIQHCGITQIHMGPAHKLQYKEDDTVYYDGRNRGIRNVLGVTAACLLVRKEVFEEAGRFDETMKVAFNDVDLCYRIYEAGYFNVVHQDVMLYHHESLSRGSDESEEKQLRFAGEKRTLYEKHKELWMKDPYYHPYFTKEILDTDFSFAWEYRPVRDKAVVPRKTALPEKLREDECAAPLIEYAGGLKEWFLDEHNISLIEDYFGYKELLYVQGSLVVIGSDNALYERFMIFSHRESSVLYEAKLPSCYRPDLVRNLPDQMNVGLDGFSSFIDAREMKKGKYDLWMMVKDTISGTYILRKTSRWIKI